MNKLSLLSALFFLTNLYGEEIENPNPQVAKDSIIESNNSQPVVHYLSASSSLSSLNQSLFPNDNKTSYVAFDTNLVKSLGFEHPVKGDNTKFKVEHSGIYLIGYSMSMANVSTSVSFMVYSYISANGMSTSTPQTTSLSHEQALLEGTITNQFFIPATSPTNLQVSPISTSTIAKLERDDILQLAILNDGTPFAVFAPKLFITEITDSIKIK